MAEEIPQVNPQIKIELYISIATGLAHVFERCGWQLVGRDDYEATLHWPKPDAPVYP